MDEEPQIPIISEQNQEERQSTANEELKVIKLLEEKSKSATTKPKLPEFDADGVSLIEDEFAQYYDEKGTQYPIKRFTWRNKNKIEIQVINYGARVISIKLPDRKGELEDVLLGFDDLAGYLFYDKFYFGSVIGRVSNIVKNSTFVLNNKKVTVNSNHGRHCINGGFKGLDKTVWDTYITGKKVIMSHISPHLTEGYPGDLLIRIIFEISAKNEFKVSINAQTTRPTCIDLSHLLYFNLAGHHRGAEEIYRHILTLNCNCFTPQISKIPTGEILNVIHTQFDFQVPKILGKVIGLEPKDGFDQNLCVNRGMYQNECFVGRLLHPPSGRMLEIYSNQPGVRLNTANNFGYGNVKSIEDLIKSQSKIRTIPSVVEKPDKAMLLFQKVHEKVADLLKLDEQENYNEIKELIQKLSRFKANGDNESKIKLLEQGFKVTSMQNEYLKKAREIACENEETDDDCLDLKDVLSDILKIVEVTESEVNEIPKQRTSATGSNTRDSKPNEKFTKAPSISTNHSKLNSHGVNTIPAYYRDFGQIRGKGQAVYKTHGAIALQTQNYPNAVNIRHFPNTILNPGDVYKHDIVYRFWIRAGNPNKWIKRNLNESKRGAK